MSVDLKWPVPYMIETHLIVQDFPGWVFSDGMEIQESPTPSHMGDFRLILA